jgi:hypothetical protein
MTRTADVGQNTICRREREHILLACILRIASHGRMISTSHHDALAVIARQAAQRLGAVAV